MSVKYETTVKLPSNGRLYDDIPTELTIRAMTTAEEKLILGSTSEDAFDRILKNCVVNPANLDINKLVSSDKHFLMLKLRTHTYGSMYNVNCRCPECKNRIELDVNLDEFPIYELPEGFSEPIEFELPVNGDKLSCRLLRGSDLESIRKQAKKLSKSMKVNAKELSFDMRMAKYITKINDEPIEDNLQALKYVQTMHGQDSAYFWFKLNEVEIGYDTTIEVECPECGNDFETMMPITSEFFRPKFRS